MSRTAEEICNDPSDFELAEALGGLAEVAEKSKSPAWRYCQAEDGSVYEARYFLDGTVTLRPTDKSGNYVSPESGIVVSPEPVPEKEEVPQPAEQSLFQKITGWPWFGRES